MEKYIGMRYVPKISDDEWVKTIDYEPLTVVLYQGNSYTSKTFVPVGIEITNTQYWALTGNYNAQIEQYRSELTNAMNTVDVHKTLIENIGIDITKFGAISISKNPSFDSTNSIKDAIAYAKLTNKTLYIPDGTYLVSDTILIDETMSIQMSNNSELQFNLSTTDKVAIKINSVERLNIKLSNITSNNGIGTGVLIKDTNFSMISIGSVRNFGTNIHLLSDTSQCLDNDIHCNLIGGGNAQTIGVKFETIGGHTIEGTKFNFNFIANVSKGIYIKQSNGKILWNEIIGTAMHTVQNGDYCFYIETENETSMLYGLTVDIKGFITAENGGFMIGGNVTKFDKPNYANVDNCKFKLFIPPSSNDKILVSNGMATIENTCKPYSHHSADVGYSPMKIPNSVATFNNGIIPLHNYLLVSCIIEASEIDVSRTVYIYSPYTGSGSPKPINVIQAGGTTEHFNIYATDNSHNNRNEIAIRITNRSKTTTDETIKFYIVIS